MPQTTRTALLVGANRGLGLGLAAELLGRGWRVVATARTLGGASALEALQPANDGRLSIESVDIAHPEQVRALHQRLAGIALDLVFVIAGVAGRPADPVHAVPPDDAAQILLTNAYWPVVFAEQFVDRLAPGGAIALMTSVLGSVSANVSGGYEVYRASKAALNTLGRSFAARHPDRAVLLLHPGWVRTDMGAPSAPLDVATSVRGLADVIEARGGQPGHAFLDYAGEEIAW